MKNLQEKDYADWESHEGWLIEVLSDEELDHFLDSIVWPSFDILYNQDGYPGKLLETSALNEVVAFATSYNDDDGEENRYVRASAMRAYNAFDQDSQSISNKARWAEVVIDEREQNNHQFVKVWNIITYSFDTQAKHPVVVKTQKYGLDPITEETIELQQPAEEELTRSILNREDCLHIAGVFIALGVPRKTIDDFEAAAYFNRG